MLKLIQVEFLKLRRRKFIWLMLLAALFMPLAAVFYFSSVKGTGVDPIMFYKWTAFSYTPWIILPVVLGMLCTMLMYNENQYDMLKQLWIVPVNKMAYFFSKFAVVLVYSICFMLVTATASILTGVLSGYIPLARVFRPLFIRNMAKNTSKNCVIKRFFASKLKLQIITETEPIVIIKIRVLVIIYENE